MASKSKAFGQNTSSSKIKQTINKPVSDKSNGKPNGDKNNEFPSLSPNISKPNSSAITKRSIWAQKTAPKPSFSISNSRGDKPNNKNTPSFPKRENVGVQDKKEQKQIHLKSHTEEASGDKLVEPRFVYDINCVVFVGNVAPTTTQDMLSRFFSQFGM